MEGRQRFFCRRVVPVIATLVVLLLAEVSLVLPGEQPVTNNKLDRAVWLREQGRYEESLAILEKEIRGKNYQENARYRADCWLNMALDYWNLGEVSRAENAFIYVKPLVGELHDESLQDYASTALKIIKLYREGKKRKEEKKYQESESAFRIAIELADKKEMDEFKCKCLIQLSFTYYFQNKIDDYFNCNNEVLIIAERLNNYSEVFRALINIGNYHFHKREVLRSYDYFDRALVLAEKENLLHKDPVILLNLAVNSYQLGLYDLSEHYLERAVEFYQKGEDLATTIYLLSELALSLHKKAGANNGLPGGGRPQELLTTALELSRQAGMKDLEARMLNNLGYVLIEIDPKKAGDLCLQSWKLGEQLKDSKVVIASINNLATLSLKENNVTRAKELYARSLSLAINEDYWVEIFNNYFGLARCFEKLGDYKSAIAAYQKAMETLGPVRRSITLELFRIGFDRGKKEIYEGLIRSMVRYRLKYPGRQADEMAFLGLNSIKARVLIEEMERLSSTPESGHQAEELNRIDRMINDFFRQPENTLDESSSNRLAELEYRYLRLREMGGQAALTSSQANLPALEFIQKEVLSEDQLILDYFLGQEESYCFIISRDHFRVVRLPDEKEIERSVKLYIKLLGSTDVGEDDLRLAGSKIGKLLLPAEELESEKFSSLIIVPDGLLNNLPFETLIVGEPGSRGYLIETHSISYSPALALITRFKKGPKSADYQKELLAFGDPVYSQWFNNQVRARLYFINGVHPPADFSLGHLPFSQKETKQLAELFPMKSYDLFLRKRASEENLKGLGLSSYRIIHFACHGLVSEKFPQRSSLVLSSSKKSSEDGFLTVREIYTLRLNSELVVLASCQSSRGSIERMEGIIGLPRVFLLAGSRAVVSALWSVNDRASQVLMLDFYRSLLAGKSRAEALRQAKLKMINGASSHPYYWAGYVLIGNPGRIY
ncbi:MAG: CHAT domain-containing protein [Candidatus Aminicenantes bacterium]|nr:CHAT domain-containing protein [Candidatus Aminicenantes bacterium]